MVYELKCLMIKTVSKMKTQAAGMSIRKGVVRFAICLFGFMRDCLAHVCQRDALLRCFKLHTLRNLICSELQK